MDDWMKGLLVVGLVAGVGIGAAILLRPKTTTAAYAPSDQPVRAPGMLTALPETEPDFPEGLENYSEIVWTDAMGNERRMVSRRVIH